MCGGFPLHLSKPAARGSTLLRQVLFVLGKSFTYVFLGALAGALGVILLKDTSLAGAAPALRVLAGSITLVFGLTMVGLRWPGVSGFSFGTRPRKRDHGEAEPRKYEASGGESLISSLFGGILREPGPLSAFVLGLGVGFLPCPLPISMLAAAAASHSTVQGVALMAGVGLGTAPGLIMVGLFGSGLNHRLRKVGMRAAGVIVTLIGILTICRVTGCIPVSHAINKAVPSCCQEHKAK